jgi:hypothetical protein
MLTRSTLEVPASNLSPRGSECYCLIGRFASHIYFVSAGGAGRGCSVSVNVRIFQSSPSQT